MASLSPSLRTEARRAPYVPAVGPRLWALLVVVFATFALLGATGVYLLAVRIVEAVGTQTITNPFTIGVFLLHSAGGVLAMLPFLVFGVWHLITSRNRPNKVAIRRGYGVLVAGLAVGLTGIALVQLDGMPQLPTGTIARWAVWGTHVAVPLLAAWLYVSHRRAGPPIRWRWGAVWGAGVGVVTAIMVGWHSFHPRQWFAVGPAEGDAYFHPSEARTADGKFIPAGLLMMDEYCLKCHQDVYNDHLHSAHKFSSFNNPPYLFSVRETRKVALERDGNVKAARWCAGCHDPVPFFSGAFDDPKFDDVNHATAHAGITCTACHAMTNVNGPTGNAAYTIEAPEHYPFAQSESPVLQWLNNQAVKAKPDFHKKTFLKPFHKTSEFCSTCHKVALPVELNHYKDFLRGQNHYDSFLLSGVSGHGARSFYYPPQAKKECRDCHMPLEPSADFASRDFDGSGVRKRHTHFFPGANTGLFELIKKEPRYADQAEALQKSTDRNVEFLRGKDEKDRKLRIDLFALKEGGAVDGTLLGPIRPQLPALKPGQTYLVEVVVRTLNVGHHFSQGTVDSNEIWVDFEATAGGRVLGRNGATANPDDSGPVDPWAHFINVLMLDKTGKRIDRRNPQDIFTPLYDHQIPPGAGQVVHYKLAVPADVREPIDLRARVRYRKFDHEYMRITHEGRPVPRLPIIDLCEDRVTLPVEGGPAVPQQESPVKPAWQRWNDYGIGLLLEGGAGNKRGELRQAEDAFGRLLTLGEKDAVAHGHVNRARVFIELGRLGEAAKELEAAGKATPPAPWWTLAWFNAQVKLENATEPKHFEAAVSDLERILDPDTQPADRGFDFTKDYVVLDRLGQALFKRGQLAEDAAEQALWLRRSVAAYRKTLAIDPEDLDAHYGLSQCFGRLSADYDVPAGEAPEMEALQPLALVASNATLSPRDRIEAANRLVRGLEAMGKEAPQASRPKLPVVRTVWRPLLKAYRDEPDGPASVAVAAALAAAHREAHAVFKPDDIARAAATAEYRRHHPAANAAAEAVVIYPTGPKR